MPDEDIELVYLTLDDALELYAAIVKGTTEGAAAVLRASSTLEGALARPASYAHYQGADLSLQANLLVVPVVLGQGTRPATQLPVNTGPGSAARADTWGASTPSRRAPGYSQSLESGAPNAKRLVAGTSDRCQTTNGRYARRTK